ncbi:hypothetical protein EJ110_NYTH04165 [Nymphaea thermarum]|nr:hypothetical protein EJ110_NYTH04165 [Nymphaea thermarum]
MMVMMMMIEDKENPPPPTESRPFLELGLQEPRCLDGLILIIVHAAAAGTVSSSFSATTLAGIGGGPSSLLSLPPTQAQSLAAAAQGVAMTGKAKPKKHTAKEIAAKVDAATTNRGGGKAGQADRSGLDKGGHAKFECPHCKITAPDIKSMQIHHDSKHPKIPFEDDKLVNLHAGHSVETVKPKPGVRGSFKK